MPLVKPPLTKAAQNESKDRTIRYPEQTTYQPSHLARKNFIAICKLESKRQDYLAPCRHPAFFATLDAIDGHGRNTGLASEFCLAHQLGFTDFFDLVFHRQPLVIVNVNYTKLGLIIGKLKQLSTSYI